MRCQVRRPQSNRYEFRRSAPLCMLFALALIALALDLWFFGFFFESGRWIAGLVSAAAAAIVFPLGRGVVIDGSGRQITCWYGWIHQPLIHLSYDFSLFACVELRKKLGEKGKGRHSGRSVSWPIYLIGTKGRLVLLMNCGTASGGRALARQTAQIMSLPINDLDSKV
jgi:hypothetical protein